MKKFLFIFIAFTLLLSTVEAQPQFEDSVRDANMRQAGSARVANARLVVDQAKLNRYLIFGGIGYAAANVGLYSLWYRDQQSQSFQFFDDSPQWKQVDKLGHFYSAFQLSHLGSHAFQSVGLAERKSQWYGALAGSLMLLPVELFDGFSEAYGFSWSDVAANSLGALLLPLQYEVWKEVRIQPKFSFHRTDFPSLRPNTLGKSWNEEILKDYNGQTYWFSFDLYRFFPDSGIPKWLNVTLGYGAENMVYARTSQNEEYGLQAYRQYYLAPDLDLSHFRQPPTTFGNKLLNGALYIVNLIHLPAPTLSYEEGKGLRFYPLYF
ncbi:uncharacterized protein YfiM (DUF2279 family) [Catalinimonas alkaloidigena]|uniref:DUF2279 domain-containing protein n=1 Tax=Catalinimonas alkaloidigena TaxID=1075417 RepID=UPI0024055BF9|nr:DUF2279 domain-containing protein [Catalinimonas alkaloidigena]MDF9794860.1 uncharacterized protein YfiM (DUF2279 family) [Catalinimonas alkaloidigena]